MESIAAVLLLLEDLILQAFISQQGLGLHNCLTTTNPGFPTLLTGTDSELGHHDANELSGHSLAEQLNTRYVRQQTC